jgi:PAS domain S-box-containing protein
LAASGLDGANVPDRIVPNTGLAGRSAAEGRPALAGHGEAGIELATFAGPVRVHHELHLPIVHRERVLAVASLARLGEPGFPEAARARLARLAAPAALALAGALSRLAAQRSAAAYEAVLESAPDAYAAIDERGVVVAWSPRAEELFGHPRMDAVGEPLEELLVPRHLRHRFRRLLEESRSAGFGARSFEFSARDRRGHSLPIELSLAAAREAGAGTTLHGFLRDLRDRAAADRARELQRAVSALVGGRPGETLMDELLVLLAQRLEASLALWWAPAERPGPLRCEACWCEPGLQGGEELRRAATRAQPVGEGLAGRAWHAEEPVTVRVDAGLEGLDAAPRAAAAMTAGLRSMLAVPVIGPDGPAGVLELARRDDAPLPGPMLDALTTVGVLAGHALAASRAGRPALGALGQPVPSRTDAQGADSDLAA